jgi:C1A family cysteine protease
MTTSYSLGFISTPSSIPRAIYVGSKSLTAEDTPETLDMRPDLPPVRDQGQQGSCVAQAGVAMKEWQERKDIGYQGRLSPQFIYNLRSNYPNEGMYVVDLMRILTKWGVCQESHLPYQSTTRPSEITQSAYKDALNFRIKSYAEIPYGSDISRVKTTLATNGPCVIAFNVYNYTPQFWNQREGDSYIGGHAVAIVGYTKDSFIIRNSWGPDWGDSGYTYYSFNDYSANKHKEIWTSVDDKSEIIPSSPGNRCCNLL